MNQNLLKQARQLQEQLARIQQELADETVTGVAASGAVTVTMNGHGQVQSVKIERTACDPEDVGTLEDLLVLAIKDAQEKVAELSRARMGPLAGGLLPGL